MIPETIYLRDGTVATLIHLAVKVTDGHRIACMPGLANMGSDANAGRPIPHLRTDEKSAVTCPSCKATFEPKASMPPQPGVFKR